jgi:hypothetical protein
MFEECGTPASGEEAPRDDHDVEHAMAVARKYGVEILGPPL